MTDILIHKSSAYIKEDRDYSKIVKESKLNLQKTPKVKITSVITQ